MPMSLLDSIYRRCQPCQPSSSSWCTGRQPTSTSTPLLPLPLTSASKPYSAPPLIHSSYHRDLNWPSRWRSYKLLEYLAPLNITRRQKRSNLLVECRWLFLTVSQQIYFPPDCHYSWISLCQNRKFWFPFSLNGPELTAFVPFSNTRIQ
jgi:hypothetical protein